MNDASYTPTARTNFGLGDTRLYMHMGQAGIHTDFHFVSTGNFEFI